MSAITHPALRYFGGKWRIAPWIIRQFPAHCTYVEPFAGGASVLLRKKPAQIEVYNDLDGDVVNFFRVLRDRPSEFLAVLALTPYSRAELDLAWEPAEDDVERARRLYIRAWQGRGGATRWRTGWRRQQTLGNQPSVVSEWLRSEGLGPIIKRLRTVALENRPALDVIRDYDRPGTLFYLDPPYLWDVRGNRWTSQAYKHDQGEDAHHRELAEVLRGVRGMAIISGYPSPLYDELYEGWTKLTRTTMAEKAKKTTEVLWLSPAVARATPNPLLMGPA